MKVLITGAAGRLGSELIKYIGSEHQVIGTFRPAQLDLPISCGTAVRVDLTETEPVLEMLTAHRPDLIIHCAGASSVDRCELDPDHAKLGNVTTTANLVRGLKQIGKGRLIYISTDYVFPGVVASPDEDADTGPLNEYGRSKLAAERLVLDSGLEVSVFRVCALYTARAHPKGDPVSVIHETLSNGEVYKAAANLSSNPTEVSDLARAITGLIKHTELPGVLHIAASEYLSRYEFALRVAERLVLDKSLIKPVTSEELGLPARRPLKAGLNSTRFEKLMGYALKPFAEIPYLSR